MDCLDFSYEYDHLFQETTFYSYLKTLKKDYFKVNKDLVSNENSNQKSDDSVTSKQEWNYTNDKFTGFGGIEQQRRYDEIKLNFKLNYDFNTTDMLNNNDINCFMTKNEIYNKVKLHIEVKSFGSFPPLNDIIKNLPFAIDNIKSSIININKKMTLNQNLDNLDILRFNEEIYFMDNIIRCFLLWMKYQSSTIEFLNSQCFHGNDTLEITQCLKSKKNNKKPKLIFTPQHFGVH